MQGRQGVPKILTRPATDGDRDIPHCDPEGLLPLKAMMPATSKPASAPLVQTDV